VHRQLALDHAFAVQREQRMRLQRNVHAQRDLVLALAALHARTDIQHRAAAGAGGHLHANAVLARPRLAAALAGGAAQLLAAASVAGAAFGGGGQPGGPQVRPDLAGALAVGARRRPGQQAGAAAVGAGLVHLPVQLTAAAGAGLVQADGDAVLDRRAAGRLLLLLLLRLGRLLRGGTRLPQADLRQGAV